MKIGIPILLIFITLIVLSGGAAADNVTARPTAVATIEVPNDGLYQNILSNVTENMSLESLVWIEANAMQPYIDALGEAIFYGVLFGIPALLIWFNTGSTRIPAVIGIGLNGFIIYFMPEAWQGMIMVLLITIVSCGIIYVFVSRGEID